MNNYTGKQENKKKKKTLLVCVCDSGEEEEARGDSSVREFMDVGRLELASADSKFH